MVHIGTYSSIPYQQQVSGARRSDGEQLLIENGIPDPSSNPCATNRVVSMFFSMPSFPTNNSKKTLNPISPNETLCVQLTFHLFSMPD